MYSISFNRFDNFKFLSYILMIINLFTISFGVDCLFAVPPAYYAHLAAFRARYYIEGDSSESGSATGSKGGVANCEVILPSVNKDVADVMFFC